MSEGKVYALTFEVKGKIPPQVVAGFAKTNAIALGLHGYVQEKGKDVYQFYVEGSKAAIEKIETVVKSFGAFIAEGCEVIIKGMKEIKEYTKANFEVKVNASMK